MPTPVTLLVDNGSLEPASTLALRKIAGKVAARLGEPCIPISMLHSSAVPAEALDGIDAEILEPALDRRLAGGVFHFLILPLFFGPSGALTDYLPGRLRHLDGKYPRMKVKIAPPLYQPNDDRLAWILAEHVRKIGGASRRVVLADHGSPTRKVVDVRNALGRELRNALEREYEVVAASMERRPGKQYDYCDPLLADVLRRSGWNEGEVIVAMQFLLPGRHAGPTGDVATICREAEQASGGKLRTLMTPLVAEHPLLIDILVDRWRSTR